MDNIGQFLVMVLSIVIIDLTVSGDNAIVIGMATHRLPDSQRRTAILVGVGGAIVLRVAFTAIASQLLTLPLLRAFGGLILIWIAYKLLRTDHHDAGEGKEAYSLRDAVKIIITADVVMSLDNVLAVAGASHGNIWLLLIGLALSIPIMLAGSSLAAAVMDRHSWVAGVGAVVLVWTAAQMILEDEVVGRYLPHDGLSVLILTGIFLAFLALLMVRGRRVADKRPAGLKRRSAEF